MRYYLRKKKKKKRNTSKRVPAKAERIEMTNITMKREFKPTFIETSKELLLNGGSLEFLRILVSSPVNTTMPTTQSVFLSMQSFIPKEIKKLFK